VTRPTYLIGHNTNSIAEIEQGLALGLNAFEIDINSDVHGELYVSHESVEPLPRGGVLPPKLVPFLKRLRQVVAADPRLALILFDCKFSSPVLGRRLFMAVREQLTAGGIGLHVIYSVAKIADARTLFEPLRAVLTAQEALMVDQEADPAEVSAFWKDRQVQRGCYGNGVTTLVGIGLPTPNLPSEMDAAVAFRAVSNLRFVYPWVLVEADTIREFLRIGVNGVMVDISHTSALTAVLAEPEFEARLHKGRREEDPLEIDTSLLLQVRTADRSSAGTDAHIAFTLKPKHGAAIIRTIDAQFNRRFERGSTTCVTCWGVSLGPDELESITVSHDGAGNAPDWRLDSITLRKRGVGDKKVVFDCEITKNSPATRPV
jgi:hypothetical protein